MNPVIAYHNGIVHTGEESLEGWAVLVEKGRVLDLVRQDRTGATKVEQRVDLEGDHLAPAFIDLQLYGGQGELFADHPSVSSIAATWRACLAGGTAYFQPTMATQSEALIGMAVEAVRAYQAERLPGVIGLHLEGPYINPAKRGAHHLPYIQEPDPGKVPALLSKSKGILTMMTLAPERSSPEVIRLLSEAGVKISAGHTNATYQEALAGFIAGIPAATHLYNAMSALQHRAPGMVGALLDLGQVYTSIVADGHHVDFAAIRVAKKCLGNHLFLITDAVTENQEGIYQHRWDGEKFVLPDGTLSGSALTMMLAVENCVRFAGIGLGEALRMASLYPARLMGLDNRLGTIAPGKEVAFTWFTKDFRVREVFV